MAEAVGAQEHGAEAVDGRALAFSLYALVFCTGAAALATMFDEELAHRLDARLEVAPLIRELAQLLCDYLVVIHVQT